MSDSHEAVEDGAVEDWSEQDEVPAEHEPWPIRPVALAALGLVAGLAVHFLLGSEYLYLKQPTSLTLSLVTAITVTAGLIGFTIERRLWWASLIFSAAMGVLAGAVIWWNGGPDQWNGGDGWRTFSLFLGIAIAAPLFQAARDVGKPRFPYASVHDHAWTNVVLWGACWAFVGTVFALSYLLAELFHLIKIDVLRELLEKNWFWRALIGLAFGGAVGMLREHDKVVHLLQRVVAMVLAVLAPVLAVGLILFVLALPFTGLGALWDATSATTPLLLSCCVGALILANAVIGNAPSEERQFPLLKYGAMGLGLVMLPLAVIAAIAVGLRIDQYGFTPDRLWGLTFVVIACAYGLAYLVSLLIGRLHWAARARPANLRLAMALCGLALLLATPLISFNAISTRDQVARLESGKVAIDKFDWQALAFDFGQAGRTALDRLKTSPNAAIKAKAIEVAKAEYRYGPPFDTHEEPRFAGTIEVMPAGAAVPDSLRNAVIDQVCQQGDRCQLFVQPDGKSAIAIRDGCAKLPADAQVDPKKKCPVRVVALVSNGKEWSEPGNIIAPVEPVMAEDKERAALSKERDAINRGDVSIRPVQRRQLFVGDKPLGQPFE